MAQTHRERLQNAIKNLQNVYDETGVLRDHSTTQMQEEYNNVRLYLPAIWGFLQKIDDKLIPDSLAQEKL